MIRRILKWPARLLLLHAIAWSVNALILLMLWGGSENPQLHPNGSVVWYAETPRWISYYLIGIAAYFLARRKTTSPLGYVIAAVSIVGLCGWFGYASNDLGTALGGVFIGSAIWFTALVTRRKEHATN